VCVWVGGWERERGGGGRERGRGQCVGGGGGTQGAFLTDKDWSLDMSPLENDTFVPVNVILPFRYNLFTPCTHSR
jgi:hypothetical protein